jgi:hypothetical protein
VPIIMITAPHRGDRPSVGLANWGQTIISANRSARARWLPGSRRSCAEAATSPLCDKAVTN